MNLRRNIAFLAFWLALASVFVSVIGCAEDENEKMDSLLTPVDLIPDDNEISGWAGVGVYDEANNYDSLYDLIDGAADSFIDNGFVSAAFHQYTSCETGGACSTAKVDVRIYDQGNETNARNTYDKVSTRIGLPWNEVGVEGRIDESGLASYTIEFWEDKFFVQVIIDEKTDEALNIAKLFASDISSKIR